MEAITKLCKYFDTQLSLKAGMIIISGVSLIISIILATSTPSRIFLLKL